MVDDAAVTLLIREGRHEEAARICAEGGQPARAAGLLAQIWRYAEAVAIASEAGLYDEAYRHALSSGDRELAASVIASVTARPEQASRAAVIAEAKGRLADAAKLREAAGELELAGALHEKAGELALAARCFRDAGDARRAGILYEKRLEEVPDDRASAFELGKILARFGRWDHAARALQVAAEDRALAEPAGRLLVACFDALGMSDAAQDRLEILRRIDPRTPATVPAMLAASFGSERGPRALGNEELIAGRYRILRALGSGSTGRVLLAEDAFYGREVAIKVLHAGSSGAAGRDALARFAREARLAAAIDHPNVVRVIEYHAEGPFLVMEHMEGGTLEDRLGRAEDGASPLSPELVRYLAKAILAALEAVHRRGVVHRDLKPANVFFGQSGEVKLGDFGVAHLADLGATLTGAMMGTLAYMSPEQITGSVRPDASTDLYALGVILHRCLAGVLPFPGPDFVQQHLELAPAPVSSLAPWLEPPFDVLIARLLAKDPSKRPRTATEVLESLNALPWARAERDARIGVVPRRALSEPPQPGASSGLDRYRPIETRADGSAIAEDELLRRKVLLVPCDAARAEALRAFARIGSPFVQGVWSIDANAGRAVLELPEGEHPCTAALGPEPIAQLREALATLHARGLAHGAIDADHVTLSRGRAVLWIPIHRSTDPDRDLRALARMESRPRDE